MPKTIIFGECHPDPITRTLVDTNLSYLKSKGYSHVGFEHDNDKTLDFEINSLTPHLDAINSRLKDFSMEELIEAEPRNAYVLLCYESDKKLLALLHTIKQQKMIYYGLDIAQLGNRFAANLSRQQITTKLVDETNIMQEREKIMTERLLHIFRAKHASVNIIGTIHMPCIQELLIKSLGKKTVEANFIFIIPDSVYYLENEQQYKQSFIDDLDKCPLKTARLLLNSDMQSAFRYVLRNYCFNEEPLHENDVLEEKSIIKPCCGLIDSIFNFFKRPAVAENNKVVANITPYKKMN